MKKYRLAVLISGRGSNLQALIDACGTEDYPAEIAVVISNVPNAQGLARAASADIPAMIVDHTYFKGDKSGFEHALAATIEHHNVDLICLAGFMRILSADFLSRFKDKVINIHPSLLPKHKGLDTHEKVIAAGDKKHGCSVHVVTSEMDGGAILEQRIIDVQGHDTVDSLATRVLAEEHILYPAIVRDLAEGRVIIRAGSIETSPTIRHDKTIHESEVKVTQPSQHTASPSQDDIKNAQDMWEAFTKYSIIAGGAVAVVLALLAAFVA